MVLPWPQIALLQMALLLGGSLQEEGGGGDLSPGALAPVLRHLQMRDPIVLSNGTTLQARKSNKIGFAHV